MFPCFTMGSQVPLASKAVSGTQMWTAPQAAWLGAGKRRLGRSVRMMYVCFCPGLWLEKAGILTHACITCRRKV